MCRGGSIQWSGQPIRILDMPSPPILSEVAHTTPPTKHLEKVERRHSPPATSHDTTTTVLEY